MKRSQINKAVKAATSFFVQTGWALPPSPKWDVTDFGLGHFDHCGLVLVNLCEEPEYCEKLMYALENQITPLHYHKKKKEDIICRHGLLVVRLWPEGAAANNVDMSISINGKLVQVFPGKEILLQAGERITIVPGVWHEFYPQSAGCVIGEVSTANDDLNDNFFKNPDIGRFAGIEEDEPVLVHLVSDKSVPNA